MDKQSKEVKIVRSVCLNNKRFGYTDKLDYSEAMKRDFRAALFSLAISNMQTVQIIMGNANCAARSVLNFYSA